LTKPIIPELSNTLLAAGSVHCCVFFTDYCLQYEIEVCEKQFRILQDENIELKEMYLFP